MGEFTEEEKELMKQKPVVVYCHTCKEKEKAERSQSNDYFGITREPIYDFGTKKTKMEWNLEVGEKGGECRIIFGIKYCPFCGEKLKVDKTKDSGVRLYDAGDGIYLRTYIPDMEVKK